MKPFKLSRKDNIRVTIRDNNGLFLLSFFDGGFSNQLEVFSYARNRLPKWYSQRMIEVTIACEQKSHVKNFRIASGIN